MSLVIGMLYILIDLTSRPEWHSFNLLRCHKQYNVAIYTRFFFSSSGDFVTNSQLFFFPTFYLCFIFYCLSIFVYYLKFFLKYNDEYFVHLTLKTNQTKKKWYFILWLFIIMQLFNILKLYYYCNYLTYW